MVYLVFNGKATVQTQETVLPPAVAFGIRWLLVRAESEAQATAGAEDYMSRHLRLMQPGGHPNMFDTLVVAYRAGALRESPPVLATPPLPR